MIEMMEYKYDGTLPLMLIETSDEKHKYVDGDFTFIMIEMWKINMMGLYLYNDRDEKHK